MLEAFGGRLGKTDCEKLLFLFCNITQRDYYDFFPYHYGAFSLVSYYDKNFLTRTGFLEDSEDFSLARNESFISQLKCDDKRALLAFVTEVKVRGNALIKKVYQEYPYFALKSKITSRVLNPDQLRLSKNLHWNFDNTPCLFTLGYEGLSIDAYLNKLIANNIHVLVDVRNNPFSMKYGFSNPRFRNYIANIGIKYHHFPQLGIPSKLRKGLGTTQSYTSLFTFYEREILPQNIVYLEKIKQFVQEQSRVALTCFEADYHFCHRQKIVQYLEKSQGFDGRILHLD